MEGEHGPQSQAQAFQMLEKALDRIATAVCERMDRLEQRLLDIQAVLEQQQGGDMYANTIDLRSITNDTPRPASSHASALTLREMGSVVSRNYLLTKAVGLKKQGMSGYLLLQQGYTTSDLKAVGFEAVELRAEGFTAKELFKAGYGMHELIQARYTAEDLTGSDEWLTSSSNPLRNVVAGSVFPAVIGHSTEPSNSVQTTSSPRSSKPKHPMVSFAGVPDSVQWRPGSLASFQDETKSDCTRDTFPELATEDRTSNKPSVTSLRAMGCSVYEIVQQGYPLSLIRAEGVSASTLREEGFKMADLIEAGYTDVELQLARYNEEDVYDAESYNYS